MIPESAATFCSKVNEEYVLSLAVPILRRSSSRAQGQSRIPDGRISDASRRRAPLPASSLAIRYGFLPCTLRLGPAWIIGRDAESAMETSIREAAAFLHTMNDRCDRGGWLRPASVNVSPGCRSSGEAGVGLLRGSGLRGAAAGGKV